MAFIPAAEFSSDDGWSCGDFPCADDIEGFLERIRVPSGFSVSHVGRFPGQVQQITYGQDGRLYATVLENGTRLGGVYVMNADGTSERYTTTVMVSPLGLAFQPNTDTLYVTARLTREQGGVLWRIRSNGDASVVIDDLPCCYQLVGNQPNGIAFGDDGLMYMGVGALTDHAESPRPETQAFAEIQANEAAILQVDPHTGTYREYATGIRNPYDLAFDSRGRLFATDIGLVTGEGDRLLRVQEGGNYGFPYYRTRGCAECPPTRGGLDALPDLLTFPNYTLPHGVTVYNGANFPRNMQNTLFVALWNGTDWAQRVVWINPDDPVLENESYVPQPFVTGLIRPTDVIVAPDGSLVVADFVYGHVWRVTYNSDSAGTGDTPTVQTTSTEDGAFALPTAQATAIPSESATASATTATDATSTATKTPEPPTQGNPLFFATNTPVGE